MESKLSESESATQWANQAREFLRAVEKLLAPTQNDLTGWVQSSPALVLLAFAYEHIFKCERIIVGREYAFSHDLIALFHRTGNDFQTKVADAAKLIGAGPPGLKLTEHGSLIPETQPDICYFRQQLGLLNAWTFQIPSVDQNHKPAKFLARYPRVGIHENALVDTKYLHGLGNQLQLILLSDATNTTA